MKKSILLIIAISSILLLSCSSDTRIIEDIDKVYNDNKGYETTLEMRIIDDKRESIYKMKEKYIKDNIVSFEILEPKESKGIIIEYKDDKIYLNHASIRQSITLKAVKDFDKGILLINFFENLDLIESIDKEEIDGKDYYIINYLPEETNKYNHERYIYLRKKNLEPYRMEINDRKGNTRVIIEYEDFKYIKDD